MLFILAMFLFLGSGWKPEAYFGWARCSHVFLPHQPCADACLLTPSNIKIAVLDLDGGLVGGALRGAAVHVPFTTSVLPNSTTYAWLEHAVDHGSYHAALVAQPGATAALAAALAAQQAGATPVLYNPLAAVTLLYDDGRGGSVMGSLLRSTAAQIVGMASAVVERQVLNTSLAPAVSLTTQLMHPVPHAGMNLSGGIAYILCWIMMLTITMICLKLYEAWEKAGVRRDHAVYARIAHEVLVALVLSFWPPVVLQCLGAGLTGRVFFAFWAFAWLSMTTFGFMITALMRELGMELGGLVHLLFLISNLVSSGAISPVDLTPPYYKVGYALPFHNAVAGTRTILFGSYNEGVGRNVGILFAWVGLVLLRAASRVVVTRREVHAALAAQAAEAKQADGHSS